jgi:hypothetical protein
MRSATPEKDGKYRAAYSEQVHGSLQPPHEVSILSSSHSDDGEAIIHVEISPIPWGIPAIG